MIVPDFFVGAMIDCLIYKGADRQNVIKCLHWLNDRIDSLNREQHKEVYERLHRIMIFDESKSLVALRCAFSDIEKDLWLSIHNKTQKLMSKDHTNYA